MHGMWLKIVLVYLCGLAATSPLGMMGPLVGDIQRHFDVDSQAVGIALAGQLLPLAFAGVLLARGMISRFAGALIVVTAVSGGVAFYVPWGVLPVALAGAIAQQVAMGGFIAVTYSLLPRALPDPSMSGTAVGLVGQITGLGATAAAPLFLTVLALGQWSYLLSLVAVAWAASLVLMPAARAAVPGTAGPVLAS
ncbi:hypothetical protein PS874_01550 [Pseudomonas fluorescens]|nr:hypothetical protein PS874_01550 [Pseudomonas fluorescens]